MIFRQGVCKFCLLRVFYDDAFEMWVHITTDNIGCEVCNIENDQSAEPICTHPDMLMEVILNEVQTL